MTIDETRAAICTLLNRVLGDDRPVLIVEDEESFHSAEQCLRDAEKVAFDLETAATGSGLRWWADDARVVTAAFSTPTLHIAVGLSHPQSPVQASDDDLNVLVAAAFSGGATVYGHNIKFDLHWIDTNKQVDVQWSQVVDTLLTSRLLDETAPGGLKERAVADLGIERWDEGVNLSDPESTPFADLLAYNVLDTAVTLRLGVHHERMLDVDPAEADPNVDPEAWFRSMHHALLHAHVTPAWGALHAAEHNGMMLDVEHVLDDLERCEHEKVSL